MRRSQFATRARVTEGRCPSSIYPFRWRQASLHEACVASPLLTFHRCVFVSVEFLTSMDDPPIYMQGSSVPVTFTLSLRDLSIWSEETYAWAPVAGNFTVSIGASSRDIRLSGTFMQ